MFAAKKVLAQDSETRGIAEMELSVLEQVSGKPGIVGYHGSLRREVPNTRGHREYWMLLEFCPNGSLIAQASRTQNNHCGSCNSGFTINDDGLTCVALVNECLS